MKLLRFKIRPLSAWRTPWQADTLAGMLCWAAARLGERDLLEDVITAPALRGSPPFVFSDAFPGDLLPVPATLRCHHWPENERKIIKRARWLTPNDFLAVQTGKSIEAGKLLPDTFFVNNGRLRNTLDRATQGTAEHGGLWPSTETWLGKEHNYLSIYARVTDAFIPDLYRLMGELSQTGFGADKSAGLGQFELLGEPESGDWIDDQPVEDGGCVALSSFQPAADNPTVGYWETFVKYGKLGPDFGLENVFKRPLLMFRPGASFAMSPPSGFLGRTVPMEELLSPDIVDQLRVQNRRAVHFAFALTIPFPFHE
jgi:CRISPR-associated protein Csm4